MIIEKSAPSETPVLKSERHFRAFICLLTLHSALLIASNAAGAKIIALPGGLAASATVIAYMLSFVILDTIAELFGRNYSRLTINLGLGAIIVSVLFFEVAIHLPPASFWTNQPAFESVLGSAPRILAGGWTAYLVGQYVDLSTFLRIKKSRLGSNKLWLRAWASMAISQALDSTIFMSIAFYGVVPLGPAILGQYVVKLIIATAATPIVYALVGWTRSYFRAA